MTTIGTADCLQRLQSHNVHIKGYDLADRVSVAHASQKLDSGGNLDVYFPDTPVQVRMVRDGVVLDTKVQPTETAGENIRTFQANQQQLQRMAAVLSGCDGELSEADRELKSSISRLIANGAAFSVERHGTAKGVRVPRAWLPGTTERVSRVNESLKLEKADDKRGLAILLHQFTSAATGQNLYRQGTVHTYLCSGTSRHEISTPEQLNAIAGNFNS